MRHLELITPYGNRYWVHHEGYIERQDGLNSPSRAWIMRGLIGCNNNHFIPLAMIDQAWLDANPLRYKNGNPRWTVRDVDHGFERAWGNTKYHGVASIRIISP